MLPRTRAHVDEMVRGADDFRVMFDHEEGVSRVPEAMKHIDKIADIAGMQPDARLIQNEEGIYQRYAEGGRQIYPLYLPAAQSSGLTIKSQVGQPHIDQVAES